MNAHQYLSFRKCNMGTSVVQGLEYWQRTDMFYRRSSLWRAVLLCVALSSFSYGYNVPREERGAFQTPHMATEAPYGSSQGVVEPDHNTTRLFVAVLSSHFHKDLCESLPVLDKNVFHATPSDLYVFSIENSARTFVQTWCPDAVSRGTITYASLDHGWYTPREAANASEWQLKEFPEDYRRMGLWRLTHPFGLAKALGYLWVLQIDSNSFVTQQLQFNLIENLNRKGADMAGRATEIDVPTWGLPEITRYFLVAEQIFPTTLFDFCMPPNIDGLYTLSSESFPGQTHGEPARDLRETGGWNRTVVSGNFVAIRTDFWFRQDVQKYLKLVLSTGGHFRFRWNEQAVMAMIWQIFVPYHKFHIFDFGYEHGK